MDIIELSANEALKLVEFIKEHPNKKIKICKKIGLGHLGVVEVSTNGHLGIVEEALTNSNLGVIEASTNSSDITNITVLI